MSQLLTLLKQSASFYPVAFGVIAWRMMVQFFLIFIISLTFITSDIFWLSVMLIFTVCFFITFSSIAASMRLTVKKPQVPSKKTHIILFLYLVGLLILASFSNPYLGGNINLIFSLYTLIMAYCIGIFHLGAKVKFQFSAIDGGIVIISVLLQILVLFVIRFFYPLFFVNPFLASGVNTIIVGSLIYPMIALRLHGTENVATIRENSRGPFFLKMLIIIANLGYGFCALFLLNPLLIIFALASEGSSGFLDFLLLTFPILYFFTLIASLNLSKRNKYLPAFLVANIPFLYIVTFFLISNSSTFR